jgi:hypothetical protein
MSDFDEFNIVYANYFNTHKPAGSCVAVQGLPWGVDLEIEATAIENQLTVVCHPTSRFAMDRSEDSAQSQIR